MVETDIPWPSVLGQVQVVADRDGSIDEHTVDLGASDATLPFSIAVSPRGELRSPLRITVRGYARGAVPCSGDGVPVGCSPPLVSRTVTSGISPNVTRVLTIRLAASCQGVRCPATCDEGRCVAIPYYPPEFLPIATDPRRELEVGLPDISDFDGGIDTSLPDVPGLDAPVIPDAGLDAPGLDAPGLDAPGLDAPEAPMDGGTGTLPREIAALTGEASGDVFGWSVAMRSDGLELLVGSPGPAGTNGSAVMFRAAGGVYSRLETFRPVDLDVGQLFGTSVAISATGACVAYVGAPGRGSGGGAVSRIDGCTGEPVDVGAVLAGGLGSALSCNGSGSIAVAGAPNAGPGGEGGVGAIGGASPIWMGSLSLAGVGVSVAFSDVLRGLTSSSAGGVFRFDTASSALTRITMASITPTGDAVALSRDGMWGAVAGPGGVVGILEWGGTSFVERPVASVPGVGEDMSLALDANGDHLVVGRYDGAGGMGRAWVLIRSGTSWTPRELVSPSRSTSAADLYGYSVAVSDDGTRAIVGAPGGGGPGHAYVFALP